jgi:hypothetical protein
MKIRGSPSIIHTKSGFGQASIMSDVNTRSGVDENDAVSIVAGA